MVVNKKRKWNPLKGHHGSEQEEALELAGKALYWRTGRDRGTHWRGTMVMNRKRHWNPLEGHHGGEQEEKIEPTEGAPW
jgi:hypothetical protein